MIEFLPREGGEEWETMTASELEGYIQRLENQIAQMDAREPEDMESQAFEDWADCHEALEDILDDARDRLDTLSDQ